MMKSSRKWQVLSIVLPIAFGVLLVLLAQFEVIHHLFGLKTAQLPLPSSIISMFFDKLHQSLPVTEIQLSCWPTPAPLRPFRAMT